MDAVLSREITSFVPGYPLAASLHFHASNMVKNQSLQTGFRGRGRGRGRVNRNDRRGQTIPDGFPENICYFFNYGSCEGGCNKGHVCRICNAGHKAINCTKRKEHRDAQ